MSSSVSELPKFIVKKARLKPRRPRVSPKRTPRKSIGGAPIGVDHDPIPPVYGVYGPEAVKKRLHATAHEGERELIKQGAKNLAGHMMLEVRDRSSTGQETATGVRVKTQLPHDRYRAHDELDPHNEWRNRVLWEAAERLRSDFHAAGISAKMCSSFQPRVTGGKGQWEADKQVDALNRYKKAMNAIGKSIRPAVFYVCIAGQFANDWAVRNCMDPKAGIAVLRLGLAELSHHYGYIKMEDDNLH